MKKSIALIAIILLSFFLISIPTQAEAFSIKNVFVGGNEFLNDAENQEIFNETNEREAVDAMYWMMLGIATAVAIIIGMVLGIKFITSGVSGQAKIKERLIPYGIGCVVAFGAFAIWRIAINLAGSAF